MFERDGKIYKMRDDGTNLTQITDPSYPDSDSSPSICPGGRIIVFQRGGDIWKMDQNGDDETNITPNTGGYVDKEPNCGTDGTHTYVAFVSDRPGSNEIYRMTTSGGDVTRLTDNDDDDRDPTMCGTGKIAFSRSEGSDYDIWRMDSDDGGSQASISPSNSLDDRYPACTSDGVKVAWSVPLSGWVGTFQDIIVCDLSSQGCSDISLNGGWDFFYSFAVYPSFSPGGEYLAFSWDNHFTGGYDVWTCAIDGTDLEQLTTGSSTEDLHPDYGELAP